MLYRKEEVEIIETLGTLTKIRTWNGAEFWVRPESLKPIKRREREHKLGPKLGN